MPVTTDPTEELLARLEPELARVEAAVEARLARERAVVDGLTAQEAELVGRKKIADDAFPTLSTSRDGLVAQRDELRRSGAKGDKLRAALWDTAIVGLMVGAMIPMADRNQSGFFIGAIAAAVSGAFLTELWQRWKR